MARGPASERAGVAAERCRMIESNKPPVILLGRPHGFCAGVAPTMRNGLAAKLTRASVA